MQFVWKPREWDPEQPEPLRIGWVPPVVGLHSDMPLIPARLVPASDPQAKVTITAGEPFVPGDPWLEKYCKMDRTFRRVGNGFA